MLRKLLGLFMNRFFAAKPAIFVQLNAFRVILLVFHCIVIPLFAFRALKSNFDPRSDSHFYSSVNIVSQYNLKTALRAFL